MKIRNGFVSNSSSSSFVVGKEYMTDKQIKKFAKWIKSYNENTCEGWIFDTEFYFHGTVDQGYEAKDYLLDIGVDVKYMSEKE